MCDSRQQFGGSSWLRQASTARVTASIANQIKWLRFACAVVVTAAFASPLFLPVMFANPAKFVTEACEKPVPANGGPMVATAGFANPVQLGRQYA